MEDFLNQLIKIFIYPTRKWHNFMKFCFLQSRGRYEGGKGGLLGFLFGLIYFATVPLSVLPVIIFAKFLDNLDGWNFIIFLIFLFFYCGYFNLGRPNYKDENGKEIHDFFGMKD